MSEFLAKEPQEETENSPIITLTLFVSILKITKARYTSSVMRSEVTR